MLGTLGSTTLCLGGAYLLTRVSLVHIGFDAVLVSAFLAGVKRTTGLTYAHFFHSFFNMQSHFVSRPALAQVPNKDIRRKLLLV